MTPTRASRRHLRTPAAWGGLVVSALVAMLLLSRYGIHGRLSRDEAVNAYAGQQLAQGVPPYVSIFDAKGPGAGFVAGAAAYLADRVGGNDLQTMRVAFWLFACATVVMIYLLALRLFGSVLGALAAAAVMASYRGWALDALAGPNAKVPGIFFIVLAMLLMTTRRWTWAAFAGSLAFLVWQPLFVFPTLAVVLAASDATGRRRWLVLGRALGAAVVPVLAVLAYYAAVGSLGKLIETGLVFPLTGERHGPETVLHRARSILFVIQQYYGQGWLAWTFWLGALALVVLVWFRLVRGRTQVGSALREPLVSVVAISGLAQIAYVLIDFQSNADVFPLLPYPALGIGGGVTAAVAWSRRRPWQLPVRAVVGALLLMLTVGSAAQFQTDRVGNNQGLTFQLGTACGITRMLGPSGQLWALGDPTPLVLTHQQNPDRFIYLNSGVDAWKVAHLPGGFPDWTDQIQKAHPEVLVMHDWGRSPLRLQMMYWLQHDGGYQLRWLGQWRLFVTPSARLRAWRLGVRLTTRPRATALDRAGRPLSSELCRQPRDSRGCANCAGTPTAGEPTPKSLRFAVPVGGRRRTVRQR